MAVSVAMHVMNLMCQVAENFIEEDKITNENIDLIDNSLIELSSIFDFGMDAQLTIPSLYEFQKELIVSYKAIDVVKRVQRLSELFLENPNVFSKIKDLDDVLDKALKERNRFEHLAKFMDPRLLNITVLNEEKQNIYFDNQFKNYDPYGEYYNRPENNTYQSFDDVYLNEEEIIYDYY